MMSVRMTLSLIHIFKHYEKMKDKGENVYIDTPVSYTHLKEPDL